MAFTLRQLQYFVAVAEQGSVSRAAQNLSISQSSVTEAVKELETDLGVNLFERHPRGLSITHKGHQFLRHATKILADVSDHGNDFTPIVFFEPGNDDRCVQSARICEYGFLYLLLHCDSPKPKSIQPSRRAAGWRLAERRENIPSL